MTLEPWIRNDLSATLREAGSEGSHIRGLELGRLGPRPRAGSEHQLPSVGLCDSKQISWHLWNSSASSLSQA